MWKEEAGLVQRLRREGWWQDCATRRNLHLITVSNRTVVLHIRLHEFGGSIARVLDGFVSYDFVGFSCTM